MKKVSSIVWQFFDRLEENNRCVAVLCKLCDTEYKYFGNTTNLRSHLIKKHPIQWEFRQNTSDAPKSLEDSILRTSFDDDESTNQSTISPKRRKYTRARKDKNVRYSLSVNNHGSGATGEDSMPRIEIQRVEVIENRDDDNDDNEDDEATHNLVRQMHNQASDEEWLEDDYQHVELYEPPKRKRVKYTKIKREVVTPPRRTSNYVIRSGPKSDKTERVMIDDSSRKDEYSVFGEYIANKLRKFKAPRTRGNIQQLIATILWQAEYGMFDDADSVKRVLMSTVQQSAPEQSTISQQHHDVVQSDEIIVEAQKFTSSDPTEQDAEEVDIPN